MNTPDPSYHGAVWTEAVKPLGPIAYIIKVRTTLLRDLGPALSPFNAFQTIQGLETLPLRIREHSRNAAAVAEFLSAHPQVEKVIHPSLHTGEAKRRADTYLSGGYGGLVGFEIKGGREAGRRFIDALELFYHVANIGDARSLAIHPASTTHSQLSAEEQAKTGVDEGECAPFHRHRAYRRHPRRPEEGARSGSVRIEAQTRPITRHARAGGHPFRRWPPTYAGGDDSVVYWRAAPYPQRCREPAVDDQLGGGNETGLIGGQEQGGIGQRPRRRPCGPSERIGDGPR